MSDELEGSEYRFEALGAKKVGDDAFEVRCFHCGELLLVYTGDMIHYVMHNNHPRPVCLRCHRKGWDHA